jgi:hypothetical protein
MTVPRTLNSASTKQAVLRAEEQLKVREQWEEDLQLALGSSLMSGEERSPPGYM